MNQLIAIESTLPKSPALIEGTNLNVTDRIDQELGYWRGRNEHDSQVYPVLQKYWKPFSWWDGDPDTPWSAVFISYLLASESFEGSPQHLQYVKNVINGESAGWEAFSIPKNQGNIQLNIGDVLVRPRSGSDTSTHGDIVYKIANGKAFLVGGNLSDTANIVGSLKVDQKGILAEPVQNYLVILKKTSALNKTAIGLGIAAAAGGIVWALTRR